MESIKMQIKKRDGTYQDVDFNKISNRIKYLVDGVDPKRRRIGPPLNIDPIKIAQKVCAQIIDGISSRELDEFAAELCAYQVGDHQDYAILASRIIVSNHHKNTENYRNFSDMMSLLYSNTDKQGRHAPLISERFYQAVMKNKEVLDKEVDCRHYRDYERLNYFGFKTLEKSYLIKVKTVTPMVQERYQHLLMREAFAMYPDDIEQTLVCYEALSQGLLTHATPTMFNSGTPRPQLSSCFLVGMDDSIDGMYGSINRLAHISKWSGGIGLHLNDIRGAGSLIRGTNGESSGIINLLKVLNEFTRHVNQGGKRKGSVAVYLSPWHCDIFDFLEMKKNRGAEEKRARDLFYALFVSDIFMRRVKRALTLKRTYGAHDIKWSLMCPDECPGLANCYGNEFEDLYTKYERNGQFRRQVDILEVWQMILDSLKETGGPYILFKDHINHKSNQKNIGMIKSSNLCCEIVQYSDHEEYAVCNLCSVNLKAMVKFEHGKPYYDFELLRKVVKLASRNLNRIIDLNYYPVPQTRRSNFRHRPVGIGVQGLADAFVMMRLPFESKEAQQLNRDIFETIYFSAIETSCELAKERAKKLGNVSREDLETLKKDSSMIEYLRNYFDDLKLKNRQNFTIAEEMIKTGNQDLLNKCEQRAKGIIEKYNLNPQVSEYQHLDLDSKYLGAYSTFEGSPASHGLLQYDLWKVNPSGRWDFNGLKAKIANWGLRNSLMIAPMPTASSAQILGNNECFEPFSSNMYSRQVLSGTFMIVNKYLQKDLDDLGLWNTQMKERILLSGGSIQGISEIPQELRELYKTVWEMSKRTLIDMAADRSPWIDQSQSLNHHVADPDDNMLSTILMYGWEKGLKTGSYYLRRKALVDAQKFSVDINHQASQVNQPEIQVCSIDNPDCLACQG